jgi:GNAT superfamily N-acetyltransferase
MVSVVNVGETIGLLGYRALYGHDAVDVAPGVVALRAPQAPGSPMLNRVVGLGVVAPATEEILDAAIAELGDATFYVAVAPGARPSTLTTWLRERGLEPGWGWMQFERDADPPPPVTTELTVREIGLELAQAFARVQRIAYGLPETVEPWLAELPALEGWTCWLAFAGDDPAAAGALYAHGGACYFGFGAALPEHRGRGGQSALFAARIHRARELGCTHLTTETGERREELPSNSYRNILRFGFRERAVVANWLKPSR